MTLPVLTRRRKKIDLTKKIEDMKNELRAKWNMELGENNTVKELIKTEQQKVENARNVDVESTNKSIAQNFWYDVPRNVSAQQRKTGIIKSNKNIPSRIKIVSLRKLRHN